MERNYYIVKAVSSKNSASSVVLGYELIQREKGTRKWTVVGKVNDRAEAEAWCDQA